jgi:ATP-binding cassette subfamily B protein
MTTTTPARRGPAPTAGPMRFMGGQPTERSMDFKGSGKRLLGLMRPDRLSLYGVVLCAAVAVSLNVIAPKILGRATDLIFAGVIGRSMDAGTTKAQAVAALRQQGKGSLADVLSGVDFTPGLGIDFGKVGSVLLTVLAIYATAAVFHVAQGRLATRVIQRSVSRLRTEIEEKLARLPLSYFDKQARGEVLSRATNDIDNIGQTLQQTLGQIVFSVLSIVGVLGMMFWISPLLALIALVTVPVSVVVAAAIGKRAQPQFVAQWKTTGRLNAHIEEMYSDHSLV